MMSDNAPGRQPPIARPPASGSTASYVDWPAILAGGVFALAVSFLLLGFGASIGLSLSSPYRGEGMSAAWLAIAAGIWFAWVMVTGFGAGGYLTGRMRRPLGDATTDEVEVRDGTHGLMVWATGAVVGAVLAAAGVGGAVGVGASALGSAAETATDAATEAASSDYFANVLLRGTGADGQTGTAGQGTTAQGDPAVRQEVSGILARSVANGAVVDRDRAYLAEVVAANSDMTADAARTRVDQVIGEIDEARATALAAVEDARIAGVIFGFIAAATLLLGAVAAFFAAAAGGRHRDAGLGFDMLIQKR